VFCAVELVVIHRTDRCARARAPRELVAGRPASWLVSLGFGDLL